MSTECHEPLVLCYFRLSLYMQLFELWCFDSPIHIDWAGQAAPDCTGLLRVRGVAVSWHLQQESMQSNRGLTPGNEGRGSASRCGGSKGGAGRREGQRGCGERVPL